MKPKKLKTLIPAALAAALIIASPQTPVFHNTPATVYADTNYFAPTTMLSVTYGDQTFIGIGENDINNAALHADGTAGFSVTAGDCLKVSKTSSVNDAATTISYSLSETDGTGQVNIYVFATDAFVGATKVSAIAFNCVNLAGQIIGGSEDTVPVHITNAYTITVKDICKNHAGTTEISTTTRPTDTKSHGEAYSYNASAPAGYTLSGTATQSGTATADTEIQFIYLRNEYTATFKDHDGTTLKTQAVEHGMTATPPANPSRSGYNFTGWTPDPTTGITGNITYTATYTVSGSGNGNGGNAGGNSGNNSGNNSNTGNTSGGSSGNVSDGNSEGNSNGTTDGTSGNTGNTGTTTGGTGDASGSNSSDTPSNGDGTTDSSDSATTDITGVADLLASNTVIEFTYGPVAQIGADGRVYHDNFPAENMIVEIDGVKQLTDSEAHIISGPGLVRATSGDYLVIDSNDKLISSSLFKIGGKLIYVTSGGYWSRSADGKAFILRFGKKQIYIDGNGFVATNRIVRNSGIKYYADQSGFLHKLSKVTGLKLKTQNGAKVKVSWKKKSGMTGYQVQSSYTKTFKKKSSAFTKKHSIMAKSKRGKTLYIRVRAYVTTNGKKHYTPWSVKKVTI